MWERSFEKSAKFGQKAHENERIFIASPTTRRNFFDHFIFSNNNKYSTLVNFYKKNVYERNVILNNINSDENWLTKIEENISNSGIEIYKNRKMQVDLFVKNLGDISEYFNTEFQVTLEINDPFYNEKLNIDKYMISLRQCREIDKIVGGTKFGPHKSDYIFYVDKNYPASQLSTGQQKTLVLLLYFSQCTYLVNTCKKTLFKSVLCGKPICLLKFIISNMFSISHVKTKPYAFILTSL